MVSEKGGGGGKMRRCESIVEKFHMLQLIQITFSFP